VSYADVRYYREEFGGVFEGDDAALARLLAAASRQIDGVTLGKARRLAAAKALSKMQSAALQGACCLQAEYADGHGSAAGVKSFKVFDASVTYAESGRTFCEEVLVLLRNAGLVERVVC